MSRLNDFLTEAGVFYLATADGNQPKVRPLGAHFEMDGRGLFGLIRLSFVLAYNALLCIPWESSRHSF